MTRVHERMDVDQGTAFGTWTDRTSRLIYHDAMPALLSGIEHPERVLDLGGANGLSREWFPDALTVDVDRSKQPDIVADALVYTPLQAPDLVLIRYVLHYLPDRSVRALLHHVASYHDGPVLLIQFVNDDLDAKLANSFNEGPRHFRSEVHLHGLVDQPPWQLVRRIALEYVVDPEFYTHRLGHPTGTAHLERVVSYLLTPS